MYPVPPRQGEAMACVLGIDSGAIYPRFRLRVCVVSMISSTVCLSLIMTYIYIYIYIYIHTYIMCTCVYIYIYIYMYA